MAYKEELAGRIRTALADQKAVEEKKMMGGLTFMVNGKMCVGVHGDELMVRMDPGAHENALEREGCRVMDFTGRPMKGFVFVGPRGTTSAEDLDYWINLALDFNKRAKASKRVQTRGRNVAMP